MTDPNKMIKEIVRLVAPVTSYKFQALPLFMLFPDRHEPLEPRKKFGPALYTLHEHIDSYGIEGSPVPLLDHEQVLAIINSHEVHAKDYIEGNPFIPLALGLEKPLVGLERDEALFKINLLEAYTLLPIYQQAVIDMASSVDKGQASAVERFIDVYKSKINPLLDSLPHKQEFPPIEEIWSGPIDYVDVWFKVFNNNFMKHADERSVNAIQYGIKRCHELEAKMMAVCFGDKHIDMMQEEAVRQGASYITIDVLGLR